MKSYFNTFMIMIIIIGIMIINYKFAQNSVKCPEPKIVYKYIPRDFAVDVYYPDQVSSNFNDMFEKPTPYIVSLGNENKKKITNKI